MRSWVELMVIMELGRKPKQTFQDMHKRLLDNNLIRESESRDVFDAFEKLRNEGVLHSVGLKEESYNAARGLPMITIDYLFSLTFEGWAEHQIHMSRTGS